MSHSESADIAFAYGGWQDDEQIVALFAQSIELHGQRDEGVSDRQQELEIGLFAIPAIGAVGLAIKSWLASYYSFPDINSADEGERWAAIVMRDCAAPIGGMIDRLKEWPRCRKER